MTVLPVSPPEIDFLNVRPLPTDIHTVWQQFSIVPDRCAIRYKFDDEKCVAMCADSMIKRRAKKKQRLPLLLIYV